MTKELPTTPGLYVLHRETTKDICDGVLLYLSPYESRGWRGVSVDVGVDLDKLREDLYRGCILTRLTLESREND